MDARVRAVPQLREFAFHTRARHRATSLGCPVLGEEHVRALRAPGEQPQAIENHAIGGQPVVFERELDPGDDFVELIAIRPGAMKNGLAVSQSRILALPSPRVSRTAILAISREPMSL